MACCSAAKKRGFSGPEKCDDCRSWEEQLYWKRFQPLHFCQILRPGSEFQEKIGIPRKFAQNAKPILPTKVTLRGPSGATWDSTLTKRGDDLFLCEGWEEFMNAYSIEANSVLVFKYDGVSTFDILIFDGENFCEKESAYFIKKCGHVEPTSEPQTGKKKRGASEADIIDNQDTPIQKSTKQAKKEVAKKTVEDIIIDNQDTPIQKSTKQAKKEVAKKTVEDIRRSLDNTNSKSTSKSRKKKPASSKQVSAAESDKRERTPVHTSENLCDSFAMLAELGKSIVQNASSYLEPENTSENTRKVTPIANGSLFPEVPSQDTPQNNGSFASPDSSRSRASGKRKSLNETSLQKSSTKGKQKKASSSSGKKQSFKKKDVITDAVPLSMQPFADGADITPLGDSANRPKRSFVSDEGKAAVELARKQMNDKSFLLVLRPTNVYRRHMVTVPPAWFKKHLPPKSLSVHLRFEGKTWKAKLGYSPAKATGQICAGWKQFVEANRLEEFDVCIFSFVSQEEDEAVLDVSIFRAVPVPPMDYPLKQQQVIDDTPMLIIED